MQQATVLGEAHRVIVLEPKEAARDAGNGVPLQPGTYQVRGNIVRFIVDASGHQTDVLSGHTYPYPVDFRAGEICDRYGTFHPRFKISQRDPSGVIDRLDGNKLIRAIATGQPHPYAMIDSISRPNRGR